MESKEIKVNRTHFKFIKLNEYCRGLENLLIRSETKREMYYKIIFFTTDSPFDSKYVSFKGFDSISIKNHHGNLYIPKNIRERLNEAWIVVKEKGKRFEGIEYNTEELKLLLSFAACTTFDYKNLTESILLATKCKPAINNFYETFGENQRRIFVQLLRDMIFNDFKKCEFETPNIVPIYNRSKYSVCSVLEDLIKDKAKIMMNSELVGEYRKISQAPITIKESGVTINKDDWSDVTKLLGNKTRANLSLSINQTVEIDIPENEFGIENKVKAIREKSYCIIKDGTLWQRRLAVKVSDDLRRKLKRYKGLIYGELFDKNELLLDLSKLPVVSKSKMHCLSLNYLSTLVAKEKLSNIALEYINFTYPEPKRERPEKEKFLNNLGIVDGVYYPKKESPSNSKEVSYCANMIEARVYLGLGMKKRQELYFNINDNKDYYKDYSSTKYSLLNEFITNIVLKDLTKENVKEKRQYWEEEKRKANKLIRENIFKLIMTKDLRFDFCNRSDKRKILENGMSKAVRFVYGLTEDIEVCWEVDRRLFRSFTQQ